MGVGYSRTLLQMRPSELSEPRLHDCGCNFFKYLSAYKKICRFKSQSLPDS